MKKCKRLVALTMAVLIAFVCFALPSLASSTASQYGLEASIVTDKESYKANEDIHVTVTVKNANDFKVENVSMESLLPETLTLKDGSSSTKTVDLEPGETLTLSFTAVKDKEEISATETESQSTEPTETETVIPSESETVQPSETETIKPSETETQQPTQAPTTEQPTQGTTTPITTEPTAPATTTEGTTPAPNTTGTQPTTGGIMGDVTTTFPKITTPANSATTAQAENPDTGDSMSVKTLAIAIIALLAVIAIVIILMYKYKKQTTKIISLVMCVAISASAITGVTFFTAEGVDDNRKSFTVEKVITVDGEETNVSAEVKYQDNGNLSDIRLYSNPKELNTSDKPQEILFNIDTENKTSSYEVALIDYNTNEKVATLLDDGTNGDLQANDGIYSGKITVVADAEKTLKYYATLDNGHSKLISKTRIIEVLASMTDIEAEEMEKTDSRLESLVESSEYKNSSENDKINLMKRELEKLISEKLISQYHYDKSSNSYYYIYSNGLTGSWGIESQFEDEDDLLDMGKGTPLQSPLNSRTQLRRSEPKAYYGNALILYGLDNPSKANSWMGTYQQIVSEFNSWGLRTTISSSPTVEQLKSLLTEKEYKLIAIEEHGATKFNWREWKTEYVIGTREYDSIAKNKQYSDDLKSPKPRIVKVEGQYALTPEFFSFYYEGKLDDKIIYLGSCMGVGKGGNEDYSFSSAFLDDCEATNFLGYHNSVYVLYGTQLLLDITCNLTANKQNIGQAISNATAKWGYTDIEYARNHTDWDKKGIEKKEKKDGAAYLVWTGPSKTMIEPDISFSGGKGTINDPYQIATAEQLDAVRYNLKSNFVLINDIDLSEYENWVPIGGIKDVEAYDGFQGMFDGKGHTIKNLKMDYTLLTPDDSNTQQYTYGLFANTQNSPGIRNINLEDVDVTIKVGGTNYYSSIYVGGISALASEIENCTTKGNIKVLDVNETRHFINVGGICARVNSIAYCTNEIDFQIDGTTGTYPDYVSPYIGGIVARSESKIIECTNKGDITCREGYFYSIACGGISAVGSSNGSIMNSQNYGMIDISAYSMPISAGGIIGILSSNSIDTCINYGIISARAYGGVVEAGGILGGTTTSSGQGPINKSVNYGSISAIATSRPMTSSFAGGIAGRVQGAITISNCYNACDSIVSKTQDDDGSVNAPVIARIGNHSKYATISFVNNHSIASTTLNGIVPLQDIAPDQQNGGSMTKAEIEKAIQELGFELPGELPAAS